MNLIGVVVKLHWITICYALLWLVRSCRSYWALPSHIRQNVSMWILRCCIRPVLRVGPQVVDIVIPLSNSSASRLLIYLRKNACSLVEFWSLIRLRYILIVVRNFLFMRYLWALEFLIAIDDRCNCSYSIFSLEIYLSIVWCVALIWLASLLLLCLYLFFW